ncbi:MAG TPA: hypothetical protein VF137_02750 [Candidatus Dormibacteraeota bacterium]
MDREGYGYGEHQSLIDRLLSDLRTLGPSGIERIAQSYDELTQVGHKDRFHEREREALHAIEATRGEDWDELRAGIHHLTDGGGSLQSWKAEHGVTGHRAEAAVLAGAAGVMALGSLSQEHYLELVGPLAAALPWLNGISPDGSVKESPNPE